MCVPTIFLIFCRFTLFWKSKSKFLMADAFSSKIVVMKPKQWICFNTINLGMVSFYFMKGNLTWTYNLIVVTTEMISYFINIKHQLHITSSNSTFIINLDERERESNPIIKVSRNTLTFFHDNKWVIYQKAVEQGKMGEWSSNTRKGYKYCFLRKNNRFQVFS